MSNLRPYVRSVVVFLRVLYSMEAAQKAPGTVVDGKCLCFFQNTRVSQFICFSPICLAFMFSIVGVWDARTFVYMLVTALINKANVLN